MAETALSIFILIFGLAFFLYVMKFISNDEDRRYQRRLNEMREFGYRKEKRKDRKEFLKDMEP